MILPTFTADEVSSHYSVDEDFLCHRVDESLKRWRKYILRTNRSRNLSAAYSAYCNSSCQEYIIVNLWYIDVRYFNHYIKLAVVRDPENNITYYVTNNRGKYPGGVNVVYAYTDHFFRRYAERLGLNPNLSINDIISIFYRDQICVPIYFDDIKSPRRIVYANAKGIILAERNKQNWIVRRTFVSLDMLKPLQREAYRNAMDALQEYGTAVKSYLRNEDATMFFDFVNKDSYVKTIEQSIDIYSEYFNS